MVDDVVELTEQQALDALRQSGMTETASIAALGRKWGWKRERTSKALTRWKAAGHIEREASAIGKIIVRVPTVAHVDAPGDGPAGNPGGPGPDDHVPGDVPAANPGGTASDDVPAIVEEPVGITGLPEDVPAGNPAVPAITARVKLGDPVASSLAPHRAGDLSVGLRRRVRRIVIQFVHCEHDPRRHVLVGPCRDRHREGDPRRYRRHHRIDKLCGPIGNLICAIRAGRGPGAYGV